MKEYAPSKINLFLDVIRKREDGYHDLGTVFQTVDAGDTVSAEVRNDGNIVLTYNNPQEYPVQSDLVYKAAAALKAFAVEQGVAGADSFGADIYLEKVMPLGAGLGGGSADAAAALRLLNRLWNVNFPAETLEAIGAKLGADVPFLVRGGTAFAEGIGEKLTFISPLQLPEGEYLLICTPKDAVPTKDAYAGVAKSGPARWDAYKASAQSGSATEFLLQPESFFNAFEGSVFPLHPLVEQMKAEFLRLGAKCTLMSGSGASVFGIFASKDQAQKAADAMKDISRYQKVTRFWVPAL
ncbi:4-(cytidine 5'-diphospho)-2-C-methyl-D-erythritol kinase [Fibrobacter sp. UWEL]|uniref:4-(cytidine 5'-diphospho)-2-C-methyl-D-erythritol kinase n=1 Tax=Fibrobacter sp. UWEL TaxID=1896209 RepID=UPI00091183AF|nr:4-(cytidine 5'-diphospho)-2-C-methyl-D-erythritol kinase [Fibrobacter sp. UWEL]SHK70302.1 4-diphosphocytidyl-2-C-methyl-D-erythritol kinase [Fibrobacter sp. UWEL]